MVRSPRSKVPAMPSGMNPSGSANSVGNGLAAAVPYYGGGILDNVDIQPTVPVMGHFGEKDGMIPVEFYADLAANVDLIDLAAWDANGFATIYPTERVVVYDGAPARFESLLRLIDRRGQTDGVGWGRDGPQKVRAPLTGSRMA